MSETNGGSYGSLTRRTTASFTVPLSSAPATPARCNHKPPDANLSDEDEWTCPECGKVLEKHTESWWELRYERPGSITP